MGIPDGAHTHGHGHGSGGSGLGMAVLVLFAAAVAVKLAGPVVAALGELLRVALVVAGVLLGLAGAGLVALVAFRVRRARQKPPRVVHRITLAPPRASHALPESQRPAIEQSAGLHLHLHGVTAKDIAALLARRNE